MQRYLHPLTYGDYPESMKSNVGNRLLKFSKNQSEMVKQSFDFIGVNYYTANYAAHAAYSNNIPPSYNTDSRSNLTTERGGIPIGERAASTWLYFYPRGIRDVLVYIKERYNNPVIYITENGVDEYNNATLTLEEALEDHMRIRYYRRHLSYLYKAIRKDGVDVRGYFAWSLLDNFEWADGYTIRFGINYVDYKNGLKRYLKHSAVWFRNFLNG
ncbi:Beta-glucosidase 12 [Asimina triloba]